MEVNSRKRPVSPILLESASKKRRVETRHCSVQVTGCTMGGTKHEDNEDRYDTKLVEGYRLLALYDGHGGSAASEFCRQNLLATLGQSLEKDSDVKEEIRKVFSKMHMEMFSEHRGWPRIENLPSSAGTTASVLVIKGRQAYVGNAGDSPVLLISQNDDDTFVAREVSKSHKPGSEDDEHIKRNGGIVLGNQVEFRKKYIVGKRRKIMTRTLWLSMTRALGNFYSLNRDNGEFGIQPYPTVNTFSLDLSKDRFIVLASDGITDRLSPAQIADILVTFYGGEEAFENGKLPQRVVENPARLLCEKAKEKWSYTTMDDCTALVCALISNE